MIFLWSISTAGFWHSERISDQKPKKYNFFSALSKISQAFELQASISRSIIIFPNPSNRKLRGFGKLCSKLDPERIAEFNHKGLEAMNRVLKPILEKLSEYLRRKLWCG